MADKQQVQEELAEWIDADVIADAIIEDLEERGVEATLENGKAAWLDVLEHELHGAIGSAINAKF